MKAVVVDFDGRSIKTLMEPKKLHSAFVHACAQTFNNAPNGRTIQMAVYRMHKSGLAVNGCMAIPHEVFLHRVLCV